MLESQQTGVLESFKNGISGNPKMIVTIAGGALILAGALWYFRGRKQSRSRGSAKRPAVKARKAKASKKAAPSALGSGTFGRPSPEQSAASVGS